MPNGGKRPGAGRKRGKVNRRTLKARSDAGFILTEIGDVEAWKWAYHTARKKRDVRTVTEILKYLTDRRDGKARQAVDLGNEDGKPFEITVRNVGTDNFTPPG